MTWLTRSAGRRSRQCPGCPGCPPGWRPVGRLITGLGAPGGSAEGGVEELEELRASCPRRSRTSASSSAIRCSAASKRVRKWTHSGHDATEGGATSFMGYEDKPCSTGCKRAERLQTRLLAVPTALRRGDEVAENYPSELSDALAVRSKDTVARDRECRCPQSRTEV